jgi:hypothetical protein
MDDVQKRTSRERSFALFNNRYLCDVVIAINELAPPPDGLVTTRQVASHTGLVDSIVRPVLMRLVDADIMARLPRLGGPRSPQFFRVDDSQSWEHLISLTRSNRSDATSANRPT